MKRRMVSVGTPLAAGHHDEAAETGLLHTSTAPVGNILTSTESALQHHIEEPLISEQGP